MKRFLLILALFCLVSLNVYPLFAAQDAFEDYLPIRSGMTLTFNYIVAHLEKSDRPWNIVVTKESFPKSLTFTWTRPQKKGEPLTGTRTLTDLKSSRNFNPWFRNNETKVTTDTAPWVSVQILQELQEKNSADNFREGGSGAVNWAATDLEVKEKVVYPVFINGKPEALHAYKLNKGLTIWNNLKNPLVLQYEPLGIPLFTSVTGWRLTTITY